MKKKESNYTFNEYKVAIAMRELQNGINGCFGGNRLNEWLSENKDFIEDIIVSGDRVSIQFKNIEGYKEKVAEFIKKVTDEEKGIGDEIWWQHFKDDKWVLEIWWD